MLRKMLPRLGALMIVLLGLLPGSPALADSSTVPGTTLQGLTLETLDDGLTLHVSTPAYRLQDVQRDGQTFQEIALDDENWWPVGDAGSPQLPERSVLLAVPPAGQVIVESVETGDAAVVSGVTLQPAPDVTLVDDALQSSWTVNRAAYASDAWQPARAAEITEEGWLRGVRFVRLALRPFQINPAQGSLRVSDSVTVRLRFEQSGNATPAPADPLYAPVFRSTFVNYYQAAQWQIAPTAEERQPLLDGPWVKVTANHDGLYRVTYNDLLASGLSAATIATINPYTMKLLDEGAEQAVFVTGQANGAFDPGDYILFYAQRNRAPHSDDNNIYWLTWGGANGLRMVTQNVAPASAAFANTLLTTAHAEQNLEYHGLRPYTNWLQPVPYDQWYWSWLNASMAVTLDNLHVNTASAVAPVASVWLAGDKQLPGNYTLRLQLNGQPPLDMTWTNQQVLSGQKTLQAGALVNGTNTILVEPINAAGLSNNDWTVWFDWLEVTYPYNGVYLADALFNNPDAGTWRYRITGAPSATPWILNVANPAAPKLLTNVSATATGGTYTLTWQQASTAADRFVVTPDSAVRTPQAVKLYTDPGLLDTNQQVDYLIISHASLLPSIQPLADARANIDGYAVKVVDIQDIYDAFSDGSVSAEAIKDYLTYVYDNYQWPAPAFVLLVGDGTVDPRNYQFNLYGHANLVPPYLGGYDAWGGTSISDNAMAFIQGNDLLGEMIVSRLPVNSPAEAQVVVDKILNYAADFPPERAMSTLWVSDNPDNDNPVYGTQFFMAADDTIQQLADGYNVDRVYYCVPGTNVCPPDPGYYTVLADARAAIKSKISEGHVLLYYTGHGSFTTWAHEQLFRSYPDWVNPLTNGPALPFLLVSSCTNGYFADARYNAIDEVLLRTSDKGTIGGFTGVTFDTLPPQTYLLKEFVSVAMHEGITQAGVAAAVARGRSYGVLPYPENQRTAVGHALSGDPALALIGLQTCMDGDLDCDGDFDVVDIQRVAAAWNTSAWGVGYNPRADLVPNGHIDIDDIQAAAALWRTLP